jgi:hypothetical protein
MIVEDPVAVFAMLRQYFACRRKSCFLGAWVCFEDGWTCIEWSGSPSALESSLCRILDAHPSRRVSIFEVVVAPRLRFYLGRVGLHIQTDGRT